MKKKLRWGSKITHKGNKYLVTYVGSRVIRARKIIDINPKYNPNGSVSNVETSINIKDIK